MRRNTPERIAAVALDMDHFGELGADIGLRDKDTGAVNPDAFERPEGRADARCRWAFELPHPFGYCLPQFFDLVFGCDQPRIVRHLYLPPSNVLCDSR